MGFDSFLKKYYSPETYFLWSRWKKWYEFIDAAFDEVKNIKYKEKTGYYRVDYDFAKYKECLDTVMELKILPIDIQKVTVFLEMDGFFKHYQINPTDWLLIKNFCDPKAELQTQDYSIMELLAIDSGDNYLRERLIYLKWWDITRGDPQGY